MYAPLPEFPLLIPPVPSHGVKVRPSGSGTSKAESHLPWEGWGSQSSKSSSSMHVSESQKVYSQTAGMSGSSHQRSSSTSSTDTLQKKEPKRKSHIEFPAPSQYGPQQSAIYGPFPLSVPPAPFDGVKVRPSESGTSKAESHLPWWGWDSQTSKPSSSTHVSESQKVYSQTAGMSGNSHQRSSSTSSTDTLQKKELKRKSHFDSLASVIYGPFPLSIPHVPSGEAEVQPSGPGTSKAVSFVSWWDLGAQYSKSSSSTHVSESQKMYPQTAGMSGGSHQRSSSTSSTDTLQKKKELKRKSHIDFPAPSQYGPSQSAIYGPFPLSIPPVPSDRAKVRSSASDTSKAASFVSWWDLGAQSSKSSSSTHVKTYTQTTGMSGSLHQRSSSTSSTDTLQKKKGLKRKTIDASVPSQYGAPQSATYVPLPEFPLSIPPIPSDGAKVRPPTSSNSKAASFPQWGEWGAPSSKSSTPCIWESMTVYPQTTGTSGSLHQRSSSTSSTDTAHTKKGFKRKNPIDVPAPSEYGKSQSATYAPLPEFPLPIPPVSSDGVKVRLPTSGSSKAPSFPRGAPSSKSSATPCVWESRTVYPQTTGTSGSLHQRSSSTSSTDTLQTKKELKRKTIDVPAPSEYGKPQSATYAPLPEFPLPIPPVPFDGVKVQPSTSDNSKAAPFSQWGEWAAPSSKSSSTPRVLESQSVYSRTTETSGSLRQRSSSIASTDTVQKKKELKRKSHINLPAPSEYGPPQSAIYTPLPAFPLSIPPVPSDGIKVQPSASDTSNAAPFPQWWEWSAPSSKSSSTPRVWESRTVNPQTTGMNGNLYERSSSTSSGDPPRTKKMEPSRLSSISSAEAPRMKKEPSRSSSVDALQIKKEEPSRKGAVDIPGLSQHGPVVQKAQNAHRDNISQFKKSKNRTKPGHTNESCQAANHITGKSDVISVTPDSNAHTDRLSSALTKGPKPNSIGKTATRASLAEIWTNASTFPKGFDDTQISQKRTARTRTQKQQDDSQRGLRTPSVLTVQAPAAEWQCPSLQDLLYLVTTNTNVEPVDIAWPGLLPSLPAGPKLNDRNSSGSRTDEHGCVKLGADELRIVITFPDGPHLEFWDAQNDAYFECPAQVNLVAKDPIRWAQTPLSLPNIRILDIQCCTVAQPSVYPQQDPFVVSYTGAHTRDDKGAALPVAHQDGIVIEPEWVRIKRPDFYEGDGSLGRGWFLRSCVPVPVKLFTKRETKTFVLQASVWIGEDGDPVRGSEIMTISHLRREREMVT